MPSISMTPRAAQCRMVSFKRAGQFVLMQRLAASPSARTISPPQTGHGFGMRNGLRCSPSATTRTTFGITSPARSTSTVSPICTPSRSISSSLCSVARETVTPPIFTGFRCATGVSAPVRPTLHFDTLHHGFFLPRGELEGDRPARSFRGPAQALLLLHGDPLSRPRRRFQTAAHRASLPIPCRTRPALRCRRMRSSAG